MKKRQIASSYLSVRLFVCPRVWNYSAPTGRIFMKFDIWAFFRKCVGEFSNFINSDMNNGYYSWRSVHVSCWNLLAMRNVSDKSCKENQNTHFVFSKFFSRKSCHLWDNVGKYTKYMTVSRDQNAGRIHSMKMDNSSIETHVNPVIFSRRTLFHGVSKQVNTDVTNKLLHK